MTNVIPLRANIPQWTLAERLRKVRRESRLSQDVFAAKLGVKPGTYSAWETGRNVPDRIDELAEQLEQVTGVSRLWFLGWADNAPTDPTDGLPKKVEKLRFGNSHMAEVTYLTFDQGLKEVG